MVLTLENNCDTISIIKLKGEILMQAKEIAEKAGVNVWKVYYVAERLNLGRLPTVEEVQKYSAKVGRPKKGERRSLYLTRGTIDEVMLQLKHLRNQYGGNASIKYIIEKESQYE